MSSGIVIVNPEHPKWNRNNVYFKGNKTLWRKITRSRLGNGRNFSVQGFQDDVLDCAVPMLFDIADRILPQRSDITWSDRIYVDVDEITKLRIKDIVKHIKRGGDVQFISQFAMFQIEFVKFMFKLQDHKDVERFMENYEASEPKDTSEVLDFLQNHVDKYNRGVG